MGRIHCQFTGNNQVALIQRTQRTDSMSITIPTAAEATFGTLETDIKFTSFNRLDQPGRGQGDLIVGTPPVNSRTRAAAWPNQALEPTYSWNNVYTPDGRQVNFTEGTGGSYILPARTISTTRRCLAIRLTLTRIR